MTLLLLYWPAKHSIRRKQVLSLQKALLLEVKDGMPCQKPTFPQVTCRTTVQDLPKANCNLTWHALIIPLTTGTCLLHLHAAMVRQCLLKAINIHGSLLQPLPGE